MPFIRKTLAVLAAALCAYGPATGSAQAFKAPIKVVVPYAAGGGTDVLARLLVPGLSRELGQNIIIENRAGASGQIGTQLVQGGAPDGATLLFTVDHSLITVPLTVPGVRYEAGTDFVALGQAARSYWTLSIPADAPYNDFKAYVSAARQDAHLRAYGVPFVGGAPELIGSSIGKLLGMPMVAVPFSGSGPVMQNVMAGQVPSGITGMPEAMAVHRSGKARVIAVSGSARTPLLPDVPVFKELGIAGLDFHTFLGFFAPRKLPAPMAQEFNAALRKTLADPAVLERIAQMSLQPAPTTLEEASREVDEMGRFWKAALAPAR
ncbi:tripartite tricarboxylate transporter substrate-binding protein [Variovorax sp. KK3]|uniref:tripartite tricarboxylate transporter substrate-binding protein n=1 Tax=Variovorax sp. KK3 TaxID=1855728 RepID=UPI0009FA2DB6|nr:tripartite tricarboxylate transporter substrate-binding protein [Variovorax sp. KK3]